MALPECLTHCRAISCAIELCQSPRRARRRGEARCPETRALSFGVGFSASRCRTPNPLISKGFRLQEVPFVAGTVFLTARPNDQFGRRFAPRESSAILAGLNVGEVLRLLHTRG